MILALPVSAGWVKDTQPIMGTSVHVEVWDANDRKAREGAADVMTEMRRIEALMSPYIEETALARLNASAHLAPQAVPAELFDLIRAATDISAASGGAFDITFAAIGHLYDYRDHVRPDPAVIAAKLPLVDYKHLHLNRTAHSVHYARAGVRIDLGGIAKGYAVDRAIELLRAKGITSALVTAGGDSGVLGQKDGRPWMIGIKHPRSPDEMIAVMPLVDSAISTSGDYERFFLENGQRYHHILDPKTGHPADACQSVTIIGPRGQLTDALSTTIFVLGPLDGLRLLQQYPEVDAVIIDHLGKLHLTPGLEQLQRNDQP